MSNICEHVFDEEDPKKSGYSKTIIHLMYRCGPLSIRKNLKNNKYEIWNRENDKVVYSGIFKHIVDIFNQLEREVIPNHTDMEIGCSYFCPVNPKK